MNYIVDWTQYMCIVEIILQSYVSAAENIPHTITPFKITSTSICLRSFTRSSYLKGAIHDDFPNFSVNNMDINLWSTSSLNCNKTNLRSRVCRKSMKSTRWNKGLAYRMLSSVMICTYLRQTLARHKQGVYIFIHTYMYLYMYTLFCGAVIRLFILVCVQLRILICTCLFFVNKSNVSYKLQLHCAILHIFNLETCTAYI